MSSWDPQSPTRTLDISVGKYPRIHSYPQPMGFPTDMPAGTHGLFVLVSCLTSMGFFKMVNAILIISSAYSLQMNCWVPILFTYCNGQTAGHYQIHFRRLIISVLEQCELQSVEFQKEMLGLVSTVLCLRRPFLFCFLRINLSIRWLISVKLREMAFLMHMRKCSRLETIWMRLPKMDSRRRQGL